MYRRFGCLASWKSRPSRQQSYWRGCWLRACFKLCAATLTSLNQSKRVYCCRICLQMFLWGTRVLKKAEIFTGQKCGLLRIAYSHAVTRGWLRNTISNCFLQGNPDGQTMLASTITPLPQSHGRGNNRVVENEKQMSFGRCGCTLKVHPFFGGCWVFVVSGMKSSYTLVFCSIPTLIDSPLCDTVCWCKHLSLVMVAMILRCLCPETPLTSFINICSIPR